MSITTSTLEIPTLEGKTVKNPRKPSFNQEIELTELRDDKRDSRVSQEGSVVSGAGAVGLVQQLSVAQERVFLATLCWGALVCGWNDGTLGPLLPRIQENYQVSISPIVDCGVPNLAFGSFRSATRWCRCCSCAAPSYVAMMRPRRNY